MGKGCESVSSTVCKEMMKSIVSYDGVAQRSGVIEGAITAV